MAIRRKDTNEKLNLASTRDANATSPFGGSDIDFGLTSTLRSRTPDKSGFRIGATAPQMQFSEPIQIGKRSTTPTQIYEEAIEVGTPTFGERFGKTVTGAGKQTGAGFLNTLGTTQEITGGEMRENYLSVDLEQLQKDRARYEYEIQHADNDDDRKYWQLELNKVDESIRMAETGLKETQTAGQEMQRKADALAAEGQTDVARAKQGLGAGGQFLVDVGVGATQLAGDIVLGAVSGLGAPAVIATRGFGSGAMQARQAGGSLNQQVAYGIATAAVEALTEKLSSVGKFNVKAFGPGMLSGMDDVLKGFVNAVESRAKTVAGRKALNRIASAGVNAVSEGIEEAISAAVDPFLQKIYSDEKIDWNQYFKDIGYDFLVGGALGSVMGVVGGTDTKKFREEQAQRNAEATDSKTTEPAVSPASDPLVQQAQVQAEATKQQNPEVNVLDAATTLFVNEQGCNLKTAEIRAGIVQKLIAGEEVSDKDLKRIEPTSKVTQRIFTQLTGVQFPEGPAGIEKLLPVFRSAHEVAVKAQAVKAPAAPVVPVAPVTETGVVEPEVQAQTAPEAETVSLEDFVAYAQQFPEMANQTPEALEVAYAQFLQDSGMRVEMDGKQMSFAEFVSALRSAPDGDKLTVSEAGIMFQQMAQRQNMTKEANYGGQQESGQSPVQYDGQSGQPGERTGMAAAGLDQGTGSQEGAGSQADRENSGGLREGSRGPVNPDAVSADGETNFMEIHEEAWSDEMRAQTPKFKRAGITLRSALGPIPIPGTTRSCDGVSHLGVESIVQSDSPFFSFEQLCDHEVGHQYFFRDPALYQKCFRAYKQHTSKAQRNALLTVYLGSYADVYAQKSASDQAKIRNQIVEEIICDAFAGMNRNGANADKLQEFIKPIIDEWCAVRDAELESAEKRYSIDSMAEAVGLTFEKDGQMTVFKDGNGNRVNEVTEKMVQTSPLGAVIQSAVDKKFITAADAEKQIKFFTELYNLMLKTQDIDLLWAVSSSIGFQPIEAGPRDPASLNQKSKFAGYTKNSDPQYSTTVDFTTICLKTQAVIDAMSATMMELGHGLTEDEIVNIVYRNTHDAGEPVPCPVCYVFSRWVGLGGLFDNMNNLQTQYANADLEVLRADIETLSQRIDEIMVKRGYALATGKGGSKSYVLPNSSTKKSFGDAKIVMEKELMARQLELQAKQNQDMVSGKKTMTKAEEAELAALKRDIQILDNWTWLTDVRLSENYAPVPPEILFDINAGKEFAERYPESWKFRTTRGPAMGKAATPYADEHLGQILRGAGTSDLKKAELGDPAKNPFLKSKNGKLTPAAEKALQKSIAKIKAQNLLNGQRYQSTSDFRFEYALDYLLSFVEMQALGGKVQLYTKVAEAVRMFASIGAEVNCSLMPLGIGYRVNKDGSKTLTFSSVTGMNAEDAFNLSNEFDNVQPIMVGIGNEHIRLCMADDRITFIIPYHASGAGEARYVALMDIVGEHVEEREDYSSYQTDHKIEEPTKAQKAAYDLRLKLLTGKLGILSDADKQVLRDNEILHNLYKRFYGKDMDGNISDIDPKYLNPETRNSGKLFRDNECYGAFLTSEQAKNVMPFEYWDRTSTIEQADQQGQAFVEYCESLGLRPRFSGWDGNGVYHAEFDFSKESGYWKMLIDRSVYNRDGSYHEQQAINVTNFNAGFLLREKSVKGIVQPSLVNDPAKTEKIAQKSADQVREKRGEKKFSVTESDLADVVETAEGERSAQVRYSIVTDPETIQKLEDDEYMVVYKAMQVIDGELYPPMSAEVEIEETYTDKKGNQKTSTVRKLKQHSILGRWQQSDEAPDAIKSFAKPTKKYPEGYGRFDLLKGTGNKKDDLPKVAYNPYEHTSNIVMNDQFSTAYKRGNLVTVEYHIPMSEVNGVWDANMQPTNQRYKAQYAKDPVGLADWKAGGVAQKLKHSHRDVYLTRWSKPIRVLDDAEVAQKYKEILDKEKGIVIPWNVVTPSLRYELEKIGVPIDYSDVMGSVVRKFAEEFPDDYAKLPKPIQRKAEIESARKAEESRIKAEKEASKKAAKEAEKKYSVIDGVEYVDVDSSGQLLTKEQDKYFEKSKARDYLGRLMTMFHGTRSFGFTVFDPQFSDDGISLFFTDRPSTSRTYTGTKENDIRALSKDTDMSKYEHGGEFGNNDEAWKYLEQSGYKRVVDAMTPDQVRGAFESVVEIDVEEAKTWLEALETELPKILNERSWTVAQNNSIRRLKDAIAEVEDLRGKPDYDSDLYFDVVSGAMTELFEAEMAIRENLEWYREDVRTVEGWDVLEGLSEAISEPGYANRHWDRLNDAYFDAVHYESPVHLVFSPTEGMFHLSDEALHSEARRVWHDNQRGLYEVYLNLENPLIIDANENNWNELDYADLSDVEANENTYWEGDDTRIIAEWAKENGYDGVIFRNLYDHGRYRTGDESAATVMIAFKSEQVKSTANKNPTTNPDIRYSVIDANYMAAVERGDMGTAQRMVKHIADITGYTTEGYHGTYADFNEFKIGDVGYHIGTKAQAEDRVQNSRRFGSVPEKDARILHLFAHLSNPVYAATDFGDWHGKYAASMLLETDQWEEGYDENAEEINKRLAEIAEMPDNADTDKALREFLQSLGYDGIVYENRFEGRGESWEDLKQSYIVFDSSQLKLADPVTYDDNGNVIPLSERFQTNNPDIRYSVTPAFEKWYQETYNEELTSSQLKRRLQTAERRAEQAEHNRKAAELKNTFDKEMNLTAWMMHHTKKMREQKRVMNEKLAEARKEKTEAVKTAVAETKEIERAKAAVQHDADRMAERRNAAKRLRIREDAYKQKVTEMKENQKLKRNAARATLRDKHLLEKKRAEIETQQGPVETLRKNPKERARIKKLQDAAQALRIKGRSLYALFLSEAAAIERFGKRQTSGVRADELVTILGGANSTTERVFKKGLFDRAGNRIGDSMSDVFLCWDEAHKKVNEGMQDLLNIYMLNLVTVDRMTIESRADADLVEFENAHTWLRDMDNKEFARLVAMTDTEAKKLGKENERDLAIEYHRRIQRRLNAKNKSVYGDKNGNPVTSETAQEICDKLLAENPWLEEKAQGIYEWWDLFMRTWAVGDTISESEYATMRQMCPHYVPTYHISHDSVGGAGFVGNGAASVSKAVKKSVGSTKPLSDIHNIEDSFSKIVSKIVRLNRLNEMYMNIIDTAMLDDEGMFGDMAYFDWDWQDGAYANALITGSADIVDLTDTVEETEKAGLEKVGPDEYKLTAWRNGRKYTAYISKDLYQSIGDVTGHLTSEAEEIILKIGNTLTGPMKRAITGINPIFGLRNAVRDFSTAIVNSISGLNFPKYYAMAWNEIRKGSDRWEQFQALGGTNANYYNNENGFSESMSQKIGPGQKFVGGLETFNNTIEAATRFAEYIATVEKLGDTYENRLKGIKNAAEITVDFSRKGKLGKHINAYVPYWNPAVQGIDRLVRSVIDSPDGSKVWKQATMTLGRASMSVVMCEAIQYAVLHALDRDDEWEELNDRTKDTYYCIPLPKSKTFLKIPKNREWGTIIGTPFMRMLEYANGRENPFENYIETALIPNFLPPGVTDIVGISQYIDLATNKDFAGRTIVPYNLQQGTKGHQYDSDTSMFSRLLGQMFVEKISPMQVDYIIQDYFGDFGDMFIMATSEATLTGEQNPIKTAWDILTSPLMADARYSNYAVNKYYDTLEGLDRVVQDRKNQLGTEEAAKTIEYQTQKALNELYGKSITELNREVREMPDGEEKDILKAQIADLAKEAVGFYEDSMAGKVNNPIRTAEYHDFSETVSKELIRMDAFSGDYTFVPYDVPKSKYNDPDDEKNREYILTDEQKAYFKQLYREKYNEIFENLIRSSKYKTKKDSEKAELLEDARYDVLDATKEEFFEWLDDTGVRSTKKKK